MYEKVDLTTLMEKNNFTVSSVIEEDEPDQEINGIKLKVQTLIVAGKISSLSI